MLAPQPQGRAGLHRGAIRAALVLGAVLLCVARAVEAVELPLDTLPDARGTAAVGKTCDVPFTGAETRVAEALRAPHGQWPRVAGRNAARIPNIVHFVFGMRDPWAPFTFLNYVALASAVFVQRAERVILHYFYEPRGAFWDLVQPYVELRRVEWVTDIYGNFVSHYAHKADVVRLEALLEFGGIYLDTDVVILRPLDALLDHEFVMGHEGINAELGLCNAVMLASKDSRFLRRWYQEYKSFNGSVWSFHSVRLPYLLSRQHPDEITVHNYTTFFWPLWNPPGLDLMYHSFDYRYEHNLAVHLWNSATSRGGRTDLTGFSMQWPFECRSSLLSLFQVYVPPAFFTALVPCHRSTVLDSLRTLADQTFRAWEALVLDDHTDDQCADLVLDWIQKTGLHPSRVRVHRSDRSLGVAESRNRAIRDDARGLFLLALAPGERLVPDLFMEAQAALSLDARVQILVLSEEAESEDAPQRRIHPAFAPLFHKRLWTDVGGYTKHLPPGTEDLDFWFKLAQTGSRPRKFHSAFRARPPDRTLHHREDLALVRMLHPFFFHPSILLENLNLVAETMGGVTRARLLALRDRPGATPEERFFADLWLLPKLIFDWDYDSAQTSANALEQVLQGSLLHPRVGWQARFLQGKLLCQRGRAKEGQTILTELPSLVPGLQHIAQWSAELSYCVPVVPRKSRDFLLAPR